MDVNCTRCGAEYEFEETLVSNRGTTVKCTNCGHLFKVYKPGTPPALVDENRPWLVRRSDGTVEPLVTLSELARLIAQGVYLPDYEISRTGKTWIRMGDIAELQSYFAIFRSSHGVAQTRTPTPPAGVEVVPRPTPSEAFDDETGTRTMDRPRRDSPRSLTPAPTSTDKSTRPGDAGRASPARETVEGLRQRLASAALVRESQAGGSTRKARTTPYGPSSNEPSAIGENAEQFAGREEIASNLKYSYFDTDASETAGRHKPLLERTLDEIDGEKPATPSAEWTAQVSLLTPRESVRVKRSPVASVRAPKRVKSREKTVNYLQKTVWLMLGALFMGLFLITWTELRENRFGQTFEQVMASFLGRRSQNRARSPNHLMPATTRAKQSATKSKLESRLKLSPTPLPPGEDPYLIYVEKGEVLFEERKLEEAERAFTKALSIRQNDPRALVGIGYAKLEKGLDTDAVNSFREAARQKYSEAYIGLGDAYIKLQLDQEALRAYQDYVSLDPNGRHRSFARLNIEKLREKTGQKKGI